jgi:hypothetical protein
MDGAGLDREGQTVGERHWEGHDLWQQQDASGRNRRAKEKRQPGPLSDLPLLSCQIHRPRLDSVGPGGDDEPDCAGNGVDTLDFAHFAEARSLDQFGQEPIRIGLRIGDTIEPLNGQSEQYPHQPILASPQGLFARQRFLGHKRNMGYATRFNRAIGSLSGWNSPAGSRLACSQR